MLPHQIILWQAKRLRQVSTATAAWELALLQVQRGAVAPASWDPHTLHKHQKAASLLQAGLFSLEKLLRGTKSKKHKETASSTRGSESGGARKDVVHAARPCPPPPPSTLHPRLTDFLVFPEKIQTLFSQTCKQKAGSLLRTCTWTEPQETWKPLWEKPVLVFSLLLLWRGKGRGDETQIRDPLISLRTMNLSTVISRFRVRSRDLATTKMCG
ncbi:retinal degeneration 3, transcript variant X1 [Ictidomys tridecemlineatus]|uniref:protein RD3 isoform X1 n=1 Tax=Ictidomys tridecemlineatus TaxID=43179 RepID=UPI000B548FC0|nr:protein RD3 isoform X1 [Ictidomys tridecemlineatus]KAG3258150.1 retinal degeneration 3, transcript variant X1 [Ictidomys tridecemlineatus]